MCSRLARLIQRSLSVSLFFLFLSSSLITPPIVISEDIDENAERIKIKEIIAQLNESEANEKEKEQVLMKALSRYAKLPDNKLRVALNMRKVLLGHMSEVDFYKDLSTMKLDKEPRFFLMEVKKDIANRAGDIGLEHILGKQYEKGGGSQVEKKLLTWRRNLVEEGIEHVIKKFRGKQRINGYEYSVYRADIGSWPKEGPTEMKFAGDIDFCFVSGNRDLAWQMKLEFDKFMMDKVNMKGQAMDTVCSAHGMAEPEVYIGRQGMTFAERMMIEGTLRLVLFDLGWVGKKEIPGEEVLKNIVYDANAPRTDMELPTNRMPTEPGISMENIRHFTHDIMHNPVFGPLDQFIKAAKYTKRSFDALKEVGLLDGEPDLYKFVTEFMEAKKAKSADQIKIIRKHFGDLPFKVELEPSAKGYSNVTITANEAYTHDFFKKCQKAMWANVNKAFKAQIEELKNKSRQAATPEYAKALRAEIVALRQMMEIEFLVFEDPMAGTKIDPETIRLMEDFRALYKEFMQKMGPRFFLTEEEMKDYRFLEQLLKEGHPKMTARLAMAAIARRAIDFPDRVNMILDILDDRIMGSLRGGPSTFKELLDNIRNKPIKEGWSKLAPADKPLPKKLNKPEVPPQSVLKVLSDGFNETLRLKCVKRNIRQINIILGQSIQGSTAGRATMKGLIAVNLANEIPAYIDAFNKAETWGESFGNLATEYFRRRIPFGSVFDHAIMGRYALATWDTIVNFVPPLALFQVAAMISYEASSVAWKLFWFEELEMFVGRLYEDSTFVLKETDRISDALVLGKWRLTKLKYGDREFDLKEYANTKRKQIDEMLDSLKRPHRLLEFPLEYKYEGITGPFDVDKTLRENLVETDNLLMLLEEMKKNRHVGDELLDRYRDIWIARWEQVKLNFILRTVQILEKRWQAEQVLYSGKREEVLKELEQVTSKLDIRDQVEEKLSDELGNSIVRYVKWALDQLRGIKRELLEQPDVWDEYEDGVRITIHYLETYRKVLKAREKAENEFSQDRSVVDRDLRILTGPYFLSGKADSDLQSHIQWRDLPGRLERSIESELVSIKAKYGFEAILDSQFDKQIKGKVLWHDVWHELWKQVQSYGESHAPEYWKKLEQNFYSSELANDHTGNFPLVRFEYHLKQKKAAIAAFEDYYRKKAAQELEERMKKVCAEANKKITEAENNIDVLKKRSATLTEQNKELTAKIDGLSKAVPEVEAKAKEADKTYFAVGESQKELERDVLKVCKNAKKVVDGDSSIDVAAIIDVIQETMKEIGMKKKAIEQEYAKIKPNADKAKEIFETKQTMLTDSKVKQTEDEQTKDITFESFRNLLLDAKSLIENFQALISESDLFEEGKETCLDAIEKKITEIKERLKKSETSLDGAVATHDTLTEQSKELLSQIEQSAKDAAASFESAKVIMENVDHLIKGQAAQCTFRALRAADQFTERLMKQASMEIKACRFVEAKQIIAKMQTGDLRNKVEAELNEVEQKEEQVESLVQETKNFLKSCKHQQALAKLNEALSVTVCKSTQKQVQSSIAKIEVEKTYEERTLLLFKEGSAEYKRCNYDEALTWLNKARDYTRCKHNRESLAKKIATINSAKAFEAPTKKLSKEANEAYKQCRYDEAFSKLGEARKRTRCERYRKSLEKKIADVQKAVSHEKLTKRLYQEAQDDFKSCNFDQSLARLNRALNHTRCEKYREKIRQKIAITKENEPDVERVKSFFEKAKIDYAHCDYDSALRKLNEALTFAPCGQQRESLGVKIEKVTATKTHESKTSAWFKEANASYKRCDYSGALRTLNQALSHTRCSRYKNSLREKITKVQTAKRDNENAETLFQRGERLLSQGNNNQAMTKFRKAHEKARCRRTRQKINTKLSSIGSTIPVTKREKEKKRTSTRPSTQPAEEFNWGQRLPYAAYIYHVTKTHTYSGSFDRDMYLCHKAEKTDANGQIHDRLGHYQASKVAGPLTTPKAICETYRGIDPAKGRAPGGWAGVNFNCGAYSPK